MTCRRWRLPSHNRELCPPSRTDQPARTRCGELFDEAEYAYEPQAGDVIYASGNRRVRVVSVVPSERIEEFVDRRASRGVLEVEPVG